MYIATCTFKPMKSKLLKLKKYSSILSQFCFIFLCMQYMILVPEDPNLQIHFTTAKKGHQAGKFINKAINLAHMVC